MTLVRSGRRRKGIPALTARTLSSARREEAAASPEELASSRTSRRLAPGSYRMLTRTNDGRRHELDYEVGAEDEPATHAIVLE